MLYVTTCLELPHSDKKHLGRKDRTGKAETNSHPFRSILVNSGQFRSIKSKKMVNIYRHIYHQIDPHSLQSSGNVSNALPFKTFSPPGARGVWRRSCVETLVSALQWPAWRRPAENGRPWDAEKIIPKPEKKHKYPWRMVFLEWCFGYGPWMVFVMFWWGEYGWCLWHMDPPSLTLTDDSPWMPRSNPSPQKIPHGSPLNLRISSSPWKVPQKIASWMLFFCHGKIPFTEVDDDD